MRRLPPWLLAAFALLAGAAGAQTTVDLGARSVSGPRWGAHGVEVHLGWNRAADAASLRIRVATLELPAPLPPVRDAVLTCDALTLERERLECAHGTLRARSPLLAGGESPVRFTYRLHPRSARVSVSRLPTAAGPVAFTVRWSPKAWDLEVHGRVEAARADVLARRLGLAADLSGLAGHLTLRASLTGAGRVLHSANASLEASALAFQAAGGRDAAQGLGLTLRVAARRHGTDWRGSAGAAMEGGELYLDPLYLKVTGRPLTLRTRFRWDAARDDLALDALHLDHPQVASARGALTLHLGRAPALRRASLVLEHAELARAYAIYLQPFLYGTALDGLHARGTVSGSMSVAAGRLQRLQARLSGVDLDGADGRFGVHGANGNLGWTRASTPVPTDLSWDKGYLYRIPLGAARVRLSSHAGGVALNGETRIPILDGALLIHDLSAREASGGGWSWDFAGVLTPVSLERLTARLGWPAFGGKLSGVIPQVHYADQRVRVDGTLLLRAFGGEITVRDLRLARPLGVIPVLEADMRIRNLDLSSLTRTFSFGNIDGKLSGEIADLRMEDWKPVRFDARLQTPPHDRSRHRISQRAVSALTRIGGGGVGGLLSRTFLRIFRNFSYSRLGIACRLRDGVCRMSGLGPAPGGGYYIVEGGGLPRINVIGFAREVDWNRLVEQVRSVTRESAAAGG